MRASEELVVRDSRRVIASFEPEATEDPVRPLVDLQVDGLQYKASAKVVSVGQELWRTTLDIFA